jgi:hypothetical protein
MALIEKVTQEDLYLYEILKNPVLFIEFVQNFDRLQYEEVFELQLYQKEIIGDFNPYIDMCCARSIGKTLSLTNLIIWLLVFNVFPKEYIIFTVPSKVHLEPVFTNLIRLFRTNSFLKKFMRPIGGINSSDYTIELFNGAKLMCRIAGQSGTGANVIGLHTPFVILDEAGYYPWGTWIELQPTLNTWTRGYRMVVSGVPTGLRENNVLFHVDYENSSYTKHRISAYQNPRFSAEDEKRAIEQYGGTESEDFFHFVHGLHGKPVFALFDRSTFEIKDYPVYKLILNGVDLKDDMHEYVSKLATLPRISEANSGIIMGVDLGYTEPTAIVILVQDTLGRLRFNSRIRLDKVSYPVQEKLIDYLDTKFNPNIVAIDKGSAGIGVIQRLQESAEYAHKRYDKKITSVDFSSWISLGTGSDGQEIKSKAKPYATSILQDYANNHKIIFSYTDIDMIVELERMTYTKTQSGEIVYKTLTVKGGKRGEDHFTSALLCASLAYHLTNEFIISGKKKKLIGFSWLGR